jgi:zinc D-Ala-D-Ala dipeptidase
MRGMTFLVFFVCFVTTRPALPAEGKSNSQSNMSTKSGNNPSASGTNPGSGCDGHKPYPAPTGMEDISGIPGLVLDLKYNGSNNFMSRNIYCKLGTNKDLNLKNAYLEKGCAAKLKSMAQSLKGTYKVKIFDAFRPNSVQAAMRNWAEKESTDPEIRAKPGNFVGAAFDPKSPGKRKNPENLDENPHKVSMHLRGLAIDMTIMPEDNTDSPGGVDSDGGLNMGVKYDDFRNCASTKPDPSCDITPLHLASRQILRAKAVQAGFSPYDNEWWHFECGDKGSLKSVGSHPVPDEP